MFGAACRACACAACDTITDVSFGEATEVSGNAAVVAPDRDTPKAPSRCNLPTCTSPL